MGLLDAVEKISGGNARLAILTDNNVANVDMKAFLKKKIAAPFVSEQTWTPPLADATPAVTAALRATPTAIYLGATSTSDQVLMLKQLAAQGNTAPIIMGASSAANPVFLDAVGAKGVEGVVVVTGISFPGKGTEALVKRYSEATKQPFMDCEAYTGYGNAHIIALALERAGKAEPEAVRDALAGMDAADVPALAGFPGGKRLQFAPNGRRVGVTVELVQWQNGRPQVTSPPELATAELKKRL
jgi:branched-chain amino acid transport system substrate-binding protein